ncbi:MAG: SDR family NAD(P)-dependent oxidoreductase [Stigonema ocellatum SAG 48.90 = DSM 106950]|nr:SDR family NAD(P)-dependent oxidoreductase [Stigonema ocellatum SAG 48.90 = DSM 106950]
MTQLYNAVVLITGASGGFGKELMRQLLEAGSRLILTDLDATVMRATIQGILQNKLHIYPDAMAKMIHVLTCLNYLKI